MKRFIGNSEFWSLLRSACKPERVLFCRVILDWNVLGIMVVKVKEKSIFFSNSTGLSNTPSHIVIWCIKRNNLQYSYWIVWLNSVIVRSVARCIIYSYFLYVRPVRRSAKHRLHSLRGRSASQTVRVRALLSERHSGTVVATGNTWTSLHTRIKPSLGQNIWYYFFNLRASYKNII